MATRPTEQNVEGTSAFAAPGAPARPRGQGVIPGVAGDRPGPDRTTTDLSSQKPSQRDALHGLLAFSALHEQVRRRKALAARHTGFEVVLPVAEFEPEELFVLDEVLQLVAERAVAITGADVIGAY